MKNNKGISMVTLIITIIVMLILVGIAYNTGSRYIRTTREKERESLITIMSRAVTRKQNDNYIGLGFSGEFVGPGYSGENNTYVGYHVDIDVFEQLSKNFDLSEYEYEPRLWYILDAKYAGELGVVESKNYLVDDLQEITENPKEVNKKYVALADYYTGSVILLNYGEIKDISAMDVFAKLTEYDGSDHQHRYTIVSCIEPSVCLICGKINISELGHKFNLEKPTCIEDKKCVRCGYIAEKALGHDYNTSILTYEDSTGHYNPCIRCGAKGNFEEHDKEISQNDEFDQDFVDSNGDPTEKILDESGKLIQPVKKSDGNRPYHHAVTCKKKCERNGNYYLQNESCFFKIICVDHDQEYCHLECVDCGLTSPDIRHKRVYKEIDKEWHEIYCAYCKEFLGKEHHVDQEAPYGRCDLCDALLDIYVKPELKVTMERSVDKTSSEYQLGDEYLANNNDTVIITIESNVVLARAPKVVLQPDINDKAIGDVKESQGNKLVWIATAKLSDYPKLVDGILTIEVSGARNIASGVEGDKVTKTSDDKYIELDKTLPVYEYLK